MPRWAPADAQVTRRMARERFIQAMTPALVRFGPNLKAVLRIVEDPEIDDESRTAMAGSLLHVLSSGNIIPGVRGVLGHLGEVLLMRINLVKVRERSPEAFAAHVAADPDLLAQIDEELEAAGEYLGERLKAIEAVAKKAAKLNHQGHTASACAHDTESSNWLYDAVHEALIDQFDFDESDVARDLKGVDQILAPLKVKAKTVKP